MTTSSAPHQNRWLASATIKVSIWCSTRFGVEAFTNRRERAARVLEEAIELAQAEGVSIEKAQRVMEVVYSKPVGEPSQEAAGIMTTLMAWAAAADRDLEEVTQVEIDRIHALPMEHFRKKAIEKHGLGVSVEDPVSKTGAVTAIEFA